MYMVHECAVLHVLVCNFMFFAYIDFLFFFPVFGFQEKEEEI